MKKNIPEIWNELLSKIDNQFLKKLLSDIDYVDVGNMISTDLRIVFNSHESYLWYSQIHTKNQNTL